MDFFFDWLKLNFIELAGALSGFVYLYFSIKQKIWLWPAGIVNVGIYIYVFLVSKLYADMSLHFIYLVISVYGWYKWYSQIVSNHKFEVRKIRFLNLNISFIVTLLTIFFIYYILKTYTDSGVPFLDACITAVSLLATWMMVFKYIENWLVWIFIDLFALMVYWYKGLYPTVILYLVYSVFAIVGYLEWKKSLETESLLYE